MSDWYVADLQQLHPDAAAWGIFREWAGPRACIWQDYFPILSVKPWEGLLAGLSKKLRNTARRTLRRVEADELRCKMAGADDAEQAARRLVALHREAWQGRNIAPEHLTRRFEAHLEAAARWMTARGLGGVSQFWQNETVIVSSFLVFGRDSIGTYLQGASGEALERYQVNTLDIWSGVNLATNKHSSYLNLLRRDEPYKLRWKPTLITPTHRATLGRNPVLWGPYASYCALYSRARRYAIS